MYMYETIPHELTMPILQKLFMLLVQRSGEVVMSVKERQEKKLLLQDIPIDKKERDEFKHYVFVKVLLEIINDISGSCNIGLFGKWGTGKTSIAKMLSTSIKNHKKTKCIYFDAWKYSDESLRTQILLEIDKKLENPLGEEKIIDSLYNIKEEETTRSSNIETFLRKSGITLISLVALIPVLLFVLYVSPNREKTVYVMVPIIISILAQVVAAAQSASISISRKTIPPGREWPGNFEKIFTKMVEEAKCEKIVIIIDNLDRCPSQIVIEMLALLKTFMETRKCIYIIPCDEEALLSHVKTLDGGTGYFGESGQEFLRKIFQVTMKVPPFIGESLEEYARKLRSQMRFSFDDNVQHVVVSAYAKNPRQIIHAFNKLTTLHLLAKEKEKEGIIKKGTITGELPFLAKISIIEDEWKNFFKDLSKNVYLLREVENYFRGMPPNEETEKKIRKYFEDYPELKEFLNANRAVRVDDVKPFVLLSQETYECAIPELEKLRLCVIENNVNQVRNTMNQLSETEKIHHVREILKMAKETIWGRQFSLGFNSLNILSDIYEMLPLDFRSEAAGEFGQYLDRNGMKEFLVSFDYGKLFEILPYMNKDNKNGILTVLAGSIFFEGGTKANTALVQEFIEHSDIIEDQPKRKLNDAIIEMLHSKIPEIAENVVRQISENKTASKNLVEQRLIEIIIERITTNESGQQQGVDLYVQLDDVASQETKEKFISKELDFLTKSTFDNKTKANHFLDLLMKLKLDKISPSLADRLYSQLRNKISRLPTNQQMDYFRFMIKNSKIFTASSRSDFVGSDIRKILVRGEQSEISSIMNMARQSDLNILNDENILNELFQRIPNNLFESSILEYLIRYVPSEKQEIVRDKLKGMLRGSDPNKALQALNAIDNQFPYVQKTYQDEIAGICVDKANRGEDANQKDMALTPISKNFSMLSIGMQESVVDCIINFLKTPVTRKIGRKHYELIKEHLKKVQKVRIASDLLLGLSSIPDAELNGETKPLLEVLFDLKSSMDANKIESFVGNILRMLEDSSKPEQKREGILYLERFENLYGLKNRVKDQISMAARSENEEISSVANRVLVSLHGKKKE